jgi:hypothetical protein
VISVELDQDFLPQNFLSSLILSDLIFMVEQILLIMASEEGKCAESVGHDYEHGQAVSRKRSCQGVLGSLALSRLYLESETHSSMDDLEKIPED